MARDTKRRTRSGGRAGAAARRGGEVIEQMPWNPPLLVDRPVEPLPKCAGGVSAMAISSAHGWEDFTHMMMKEEDE